MTTLKKLLLPFTAVLVLVFVGLSLAQNSPGGVFQPALNYIVGGQWRWRAQASPFVFEGTRDDANETTVTVIDPNSDATLTIDVGSAGGNLVVARNRSESFVRAGVTSFDGSNPSSVTTGLDSIQACVVTAIDSGAPGDNYHSYTIQTTATAGQLDIYQWTSTSGTDPTLVAGTYGVPLGWWCVGTDNP